MGSRLRYHTLMCVSIFEDHHSPHIHSGRQLGGISSLQGPEVSVSSLWRNRLARSAVNRKVGGSSPPRDVLAFIEMLFYDVA